MYHIITDGSCDLDPSLVTKLGVSVVPFYVTIDGKKHLKEIDELPIRDFYQFMVDNPKVFPKTSMPAIQDYVDAFEPILKEGKDIICICITIKFSGSYNSAMGAKQILEEDYPDKQITVVDATVNTVLQGMLVEVAVNKKNSGASYQEVLDYIEEIKNTGRIFFTIGNMDYLVNGGRVGKLSALAAGTLGIKPIIVLREGEIFSEGLTRGRRKAKAKVLSKLIDYVKEANINLDEYYFCVGYGYDKDEAYEFRNNLLEALKEIDNNYHKDIPLRQIGATIGVHTGPHPIGLGMIKEA